MISTDKESITPTPDKITEIQDALLYEQFNFLPAIPGMASEAYAQALAKYLNDSSLTDHELRREVLGKDLVNYKQRTADPEAFFGSLHRGEASIRQVTPWVHNRVLHMQEQLYKAGYLDDHDFIRQRSFLYSYLGAEIDPQKIAPEEIGRRVSGMELCIRDFYALEKIDPQLAIEYLKDVQKYFGSEAYTLTLLAEAASSVPELSAAQIQAYRIRLAEEYDRFRTANLSRLPPETQDTLFQDQQEAENVAATRVTPVPITWWRRLRSKLP